MYVICCVSIEIYMICHKFHIENNNNKNNNNIVERGGWGPRRMWSLSTSIRTATTATPRTYRPSQRYKLIQQKGRPRTPTPPKPTQSQTHRKPTNTSSIQFSKRKYMDVQCVTTNSCNIRQKRKCHVQMPHDVLFSFSSLSPLWERGSEIELFLTYWSTHSNRFPSTCCRWALAVGWTFRPAGLEPLDQANLSPPNNSAHQTLIEWRPQHQSNHRWSNFASANVFLQVKLLLVSNWIIVFGFVVAPLVPTYWWRFFMQFQLGEDKKWNEMFLIKVAKQ